MAYHKEPNIVKNFLTKHEKQSGWRIVREDGSLFANVYTERDADAIVAELNAGASEESMELRPIDLPEGE